MGQVLHYSEFARRLQLRPTEASAEEAPLNAEILMFTGVRYEHYTPELDTEQAQASEQRPPRRKANRKGRT